MTFLDDQCKPATGGRLNPKPFPYPLFGAPFIAMDGKTGDRYCCYRWHSESPLVFERYLKHTIWHGHGDARPESAGSRP